jgi:DNA transformation protein
VDPARVQDLFSQFGPVEVRRMFGAQGVYADGLMFALCRDGLIYLKADAETVPAFAQAGSSPFAYKAGHGRRAVMSYWRLPDHLYDEPEDLARWAGDALAAARRSAGNKKAGTGRRRRRRMAPKGR